MVGGSGLRLTDRGQLADTELFVAVEVTAGDRGRHGEARVSHLVPMKRSWLAQGQLETTTEHEFDRSSGRVVAVRRCRWRDLVLDEIAGPPSDHEQTAEVLARAAADDLHANLDLDRREVHSWLTRLRSLAEWRPELGLPIFDREEIVAMLPVLCHGKTSLSELRKLPIADIFSGCLSAKQTAALNRRGAGTSPGPEREPGSARVRTREAARARGQDSGTLRHDREPHRRRRPDSGQGAPPCSKRQAATDNRRSREFLGFDLPSGPSRTSRPLSEALLAREPSHGRTHDTHPAASQGKITIVQRIQRGPTSPCSVYLASEHISAQDLSPVESIRPGCENIEVNLEDLSPPPLSVHDTIGETVLDTDR